MRFFLQLSYKGTAYAGWQVQENAVSVQQKVNEALSKLLQKETETIGCGRTDTGVHALDFYAHFDASETIDNPEEFLYRFNRMLPRDIAIHRLLTVKEEAHARFDALERTYEYRIAKRKDPFEIETAYYHSLHLDVEKMNEACKVLFDYTDFTSFSKSHTQTKTNDCRIFLAEWKEEGNLLVFTIRANRFLRNMVRAIVGTLLEIGKHKLSIQEFREIIESKDRKRAGMSVPAEGLFLVKVSYPDNYFLS